MHSLIRPVEGDFCLYTMGRTEILTKIEEIVSAQGFLLVDAVLRGDSHLRIIELYIDGEKAVTADDCTNVSRAVHDVIETENLIDANYRLDVSSPGVDRPLKFLAQYGKHINRKFEVSYLENGETKKLSAKLLKVEGDILYFEEKQTEHKINYKDIIKAKVLISF